MDIVLAGDVLPPCPSVMVMFWLEMFSLYALVSTVLYWSGCFSILEFEAIEIVHLGLRVRVVEVSASFGTKLLFRGVRCKSRDRKSVV